MSVDLNLLVAAAEQAAAERADAVREARRQAAAEWTQERAQLIKRYELCKRELATARDIAAAAVRELQVPHDLRESGCVVIPPQATKRKQPLASQGFAVDTLASVVPKQEELVESLASVRTQLVDLQSCMATITAAVNGEDVRALGGKESTERFLEIIASLLAGGRDSLVQDATSRYSQPLGEVVRHCGPEAGISGSLSNNGKQSEVFKTQSLSFGGTNQSHESLREELSGAYFDAQTVAGAGEVCVRRRLW